MNNLDKKNQFDIQYLYHVIQKNGFKEIISIELLKNDYFSIMYQVNDQYIIEFSKFPKSRSDFKMMIDLYRYYSKDVKVLPVLIYDESKKIVPLIYSIFRKPLGEPLCKSWNILSQQSKRQIAHEVFSEIKKINMNTPHFMVKEKYVVDFRKRKASIQRIVSNSLKSDLPQQVKNRIKYYVRVNLPLLKEETLVPTYNTFKFDYVFINNGHVSALSGFNQLIITSNDYILESLYRMASDFLNAPFSRCYSDTFGTKGMDDILEWIEDEIPEIFQYRMFEKRIGLYLLERSLRHYLKSHSKYVLDEIVSILDIFE